MNKKIVQKLFDIKELAQSTIILFYFIFNLCTSEISQRAAFTYKNQLYSKTRQKDIHASVPQSIPVSRKPCSHKSYVAKMSQVSI